mgnify:FL=1
MKAFLSLIHLYSWGLGAAVIFFLFLIAKFYQDKAGQRSYYRAFLLPLVAFVAAALTYAWRGQDLVGNERADLLFFGGGIVLLLASSYLSRLMVGGRK